MPGRTANFNVETLKRQASMRQLQSTIAEISRNIEMRILDNTMRGNVMYDSLLSADEQVKLRRHVLNLPSDSMPPIVTHNLIEGETDIIIQELRKADLINKKEDRVKVVYHPEFLNSNNPILSMDYEDFARGCHLGVFPSYYEPWGYTPAECAVFGVPSVTSNLSGFGCFIEELVEDPSDHGVYIVDRRNKSVEESVQQLTDFMNSFCHKSHRARYILRNRTERLSLILDWNSLILDYLKAQKLAVLRCSGKCSSDTYKPSYEKEKVRATSPIAD